MNAGFDVIAVSQALAALLFLYALSPWRTAPGVRRRQAAVAGTVILSAAAVYDMDVINGPEIIAALLIGGAIGLLLGREWPGSRMMALLTTLAGFAGAAMAFAAVAAWHNPFAFGLVDEGGAEIATRHLLALAVTVLMGSGACIGGVVALLRRWDAVGVLLALTIGMAGWSAAAMAILLENIGLVVAGGLAGTAGMVIALRICGGARGKGLADNRSRP